MMTRVVPLLGVSAGALVLATVMLTRGAGTAAESATARPAVAAPRVPHVAGHRRPRRGAKATAIAPVCRT